MSNNKILVLSIIAIIIIIICVIMLIVINKYFNTDNEKYETDFEQQVLYENDEEIKLLDNKNKYFVVEKIVSEITSYIKETNGDMEYDTTLIEEETAKVAFQKEGVQIINYMLDNEYKNTMKSTDDIIINMAKRYTNYQSIIDKVYIYDKSANIDIYIVYAYIGSEEFNIVIKTDSENNTFSIFLNDYLEKYNYSKNMQTKDIKISENSIEKNDYNQFKYKNISENQIPKYYLNNYIKLIKSNTKLAYNLLDKNYKQKRFPTFNEFNTYTQTKEYMQATISKYKIIKKDDYTIYVCEDTYGNLYIFKETALMDYTVQLDNYTIENKELIEEYEKLKEVDKGAENVRKFFQMLNMKDYKSAYEKLDNTFKNNNFATLQMFENYISRRIYNSSIINIESYTMIDSDTYTYKVNIQNALNSEEQHDYNVIIKLLEGTNFIMSFEI